MDGSRPRYPRTERERAVLAMTVAACRDRGMSFAAIANVLDISTATAWKYRDRQAEAERRAAKPWLPERRSA